MISHLLAVRLINGLPALRHAGVCNRLAGTAGALRVDTLRSCGSWRGCLVHVCRVSQSAVSMVPVLCAACISMERLLLTLQRGLDGANYPLSTSYHNNPQDQHVSLPYIALRH